MKKIVLGAALLAIAAGAKAQDPYKVIIPMSPDDEGAMVYIANTDSREMIDSVLVEGESVMFTGTMDEPVPATVVIDGQGRFEFILEPGSIAISDKSGRAFGSPLNDIYNEIGDSASVYAGKFRQATTPEAQEQALNAYYGYMQRQLDANLDTPVGYKLFLNLAPNMDAAEFDSYLKKEPSLLGYKRVANMVEMNKRKAATSVGAKYADFDVNGQKLSDYVGKDGKYLLVDFWASWCGPCRREIPVIKRLAEKYADKLNVLGVAVWDQKADTERAIKELGITWPVILDAQRIPTDIYGIQGIPCIILISPDGKILSRDKQEDELVAEVAAALK